MNSPLFGVDGFKQSLSTQRAVRPLLMVFTSLLILAVGCTVTSSQVTTMSSQPATASSEESIQVYELGEPVNKPYKILGKTFARLKTGHLNKPSKEKLQNTLKPLAAKMGADAVIGFYSSEQGDKRCESTRRWCSGLAVQFTADNAVEPAGFVVTIARLPEPTLADWKKLSVDNVDEKHFAKYLAETRQQNEWLYSSTQYQLEKLGYYAAVAPGAISGLSPASLKDMDKSVLDTLLGSHTGLILTTELMDKDGGGAFFYASETARVRASLFSKSAGAVIWANEASGKDFAIGMINVMATASTRESGSIFKAVNNLYKTLIPAQEALSAGGGTSGK